MFIATSGKHLLKKKRKKNTFRGKTSKGIYSPRCYFTTAITTGSLQAAQVGTSLNIHSCLNMYYVKKRIGPLRRVITGQLISGGGDSGQSFNSFVSRSLSSPLNGFEFLQTCGGVQFG